MRALLVVLALTLTACGSDDPSLSEAFCNDLQDGASVMSLYDGSDPEEFADLTYGRVKSSCPSELETNEGLRAYPRGLEHQPRQLEAGYFHGGLAREAHP